MVAAKQSNQPLALSRPLRRVSIAYDGQPKVAALSHSVEVEDAYRRGYDEASSQYNEQIVQFRAEVNALREDTFSALEEKFRVILGEAREALMALTYRSVVKTLGGFEMNPDAILAIVNSTIEESGLDEEKMEVRLHPLDIELLKDLEPELIAKHPALELKADRTLKRGDCVLSSRFGKVDGLMTTKLERLRESLKPTE